MQQRLGALAAGASFEIMQPGETLHMPAGYSVTPLAADNHCAGVHLPRYLPAGCCRWVQMARQRALPGPPHALPTPLNPC